jgi:hypothetical protein
LEQYLLEKIGNEKMEITSMAPEGTGEKMISLVMRIIEEKTG